MKREKILFADNNVEFLRTRTQLLKEGGYDVVAVGSLEDARDQLEQPDFDLAILDLRLERDNDEEDVSGLRLAQEMAPLLPKIILSKYPSVRAVREALRIGPDGIPPAVDFVSKGEGMEALRPAIRRAMGSSLAWLRSVRDTDEDLRRDYREAQGQARLMFILSMVFIIIGTLFLFLSLAVVINLMSQNQPNFTWMTPSAGLLSAIGGVIGQTAGVLFFRRVDAANNRIKHYHDERLAGQRFEILLNASEDLGNHSDACRLQVVQAAIASWIGPVSEHEERAPHRSPIPPVHSKE